MQCHVRAMGDAAPARISDTLPKKGKVTEVCQEWLVHEDGALAYALQKQEVERHYSNNKSKNAILREDFPVALTEQRKEEQEALARFHQQNLLQEQRDAELARMLAAEMEQQEEERRKKLLEKDQRLARHMQEREKKVLGDVNVIGLPLPQSVNIVGLPPPDIRQQQTTDIRRLSSALRNVNIENERIPSPSKYMGAHEELKRAEEGIQRPHKDWVRHNKDIQHNPAREASVSPTLQNREEVLLHRADKEEIRSYSRNDVLRKDDSPRYPRSESKRSLRDETLQGSSRDDIGNTRHHKEEVVIAGPSRDDRHRIELKTSDEDNVHINSSSNCERAVKKQEMAGPSRIIEDVDAITAWPPPPTSQELNRHQQELEDQELARKLQEELESEFDIIDRDRLIAIEAQDKEIAKMLQDKEKAKARRAREKARAKALAKKQEEKQDEVEQITPASVESDMRPPKEEDDISLVSGHSGPVPNIAAVIDPTFSLARSTNSKIGRSANHVDLIRSSPQQQHPPPQPEFDEEDTTIPYFPVQGQKRTSSLDKKKKKDKNKDTGCKQQ